MYYLYIVIRSEIETFYYLLKEHMYYTTNPIQPARDLKKDMEKKLHIHILNNIILNSDPSKHQTPSFDISIHQAGNVLLLELHQDDYYQYY